MTLRHFDPSGSKCLIVGRKQLLRLFVNVLMFHPLQSVVQTVTWEEDGQGRITKQQTVSSLYLKCSSFWIL